MFPANFNSISHHGLTTRVSHLRGLAARENAAWCEFYDKYREMIHAVGKSADLSPADCEDLMQQTIAVCCQRLRHFIYNPRRCRFRTFLFGIARNLAFNISRRNRKYRGDQIDDNMQDDPPEELAYASEVDRQFMAEYERYLFSNCIKRLKRSVDSDTYVAFDLLVLQERPIAEVAAITGKTPGALYGIKHRVVKKLKLVIAELEHELAARSAADGESETASGAVR